MNDTTIEVDQTEEETLNLFTYEVSDEALEAAADTIKGVASIFTFHAFPPSYCC